MIYEMYDCQYLILMEISLIVVSMIICSIANNLIITIHLKEKKQKFLCTNSKIFFLKKNLIENLKDKIFKRL